MKALASKKGYYFLIDAIIGILVMALAFTFIFSKPVTVPTKSRIGIISNDALLFLSTNRIEDINDPYAGVNGVLWNASEITNSKNTLLQQIGEFYHKGKFEIADKFIEAVLRNIIPKQFNIEIAVNDEVVYPLESRNRISKERGSIVVVAKSIVFGSDNEKNSMWGPYSIEVRMWE